MRRKYLEKNVVISWNMEFENMKIGNFFEKSEDDQKKNEGLEAKCDGLNGKSEYLLLEIFLFYSIFFLVWLEKFYLWMITRVTRVFSLVEALS